MTTLITGGAGFVGNRLASLLVSSGQPIVILDNFNDFYDPAIKRANVAALGKDVPVIEGDIRDSALVTRLFGEHKITRVAHLAGLANVRKSIEFGDEYADVNTTGSVNLMNIARKFPVSVFVQISTHHQHHRLLQNRRQPVGRHGKRRRRAEKGQRRLITVGQQAIAEHTDKLAVVQIMAELNH